MKILITSDNHLGYKEADTLRKEDSFCTFDEVLQLGVKNKVDLILQVGDLFHENRPSRYCINKTINILKKYVLDDSSLKIKLPLLCIHGNHDDPSGFNKISTLDILHSAGLVWYIGKSSTVVDYVEFDRVRVYGVGYIKDKDVTMVFKNIEYKDLNSDYFNILLVHQNRVPRNKDYLCPTVIPKLFNLLVYGHEHDPLIIQNDTMLLQCGSTVRTSLSDAECNDKYCYILDTKDHTLSKIKLKSVRPFLMEDTNFNEEEELIGHINLLLETKLENITSFDQKSIDSKRHKNDEDFNNSIRVLEIDNPLIYPLLLPLIRLRVLTSNTLNINKNRLCHIFKDRVSNPSEIIKLIPQKKVKGKESTIVYKSQNITEIILNHLKCTPLECIPEYKFIEHFNKDGNFVEMIEENLEEYSQNIQYDNCMISDIGQEIRRIKVELCKNRQKDSNNNEHDNIKDNGEILNNDSKIINSSDLRLDDINNTDNSNLNIKYEDNSNMNLDINTDNSNIYNSNNVDSRSLISCDNIFDNTCLPSIITGKDSKTVRKSINNKMIISNTVDNITNIDNITTTDNISNTVDNINSTKINDDTDSTDLFIDF